MLLCTGLVAIVACQNVADDMPANTHEESVMDSAYLGEIVISPESQTRGNDNISSFDVTFKDDEEESNLKLKLRQSENEFGCVVGQEPSPAFYIVFTDDSGNNDTFMYLNADKQPLQKCHLSTTEDGEEVMISVIETYDNLPIVALTRGESWDECFSRRMGSSTGIVLTIMAGFVGPEGAAAVAAGAALSCALWTPY